MSLGSAEPWAVREACDGVARALERGDAVVMAMDGPRRCMPIRYERVEAGLAERGIPLDHPLLTWEVWHL
jgi:hypothetical protein